MSQPSVTLCVQNINYSIVKKDEARRALYCLFGSYGKVIDVVYTRAAKVRGTAFVVFRDLASSTAAMRGLDGENFYGKSLRISYAKSTSHATIGQTEGPEAVYAIKLGLRDADGKLVNGSGKSKLTVSGAQQKLIDERREKRARDNEEEEEEDDDDSEEEKPERKKGRQDDDDGDEAMMEESDDEDAAGSAAAAGAAGSETSPSLQVEGLPAEVTTDMLTALFQQYPGLATVRLSPASPNAGPNGGRALVQYENAAQAGVAKEALDGFLVDRDAPMRVQFATATRS